MARYYSRSRSRRGRKGRRYNRAFLASVTGAFLVGVFLMFRGGSSAPQEAAAEDETAAAQTSPETQRVSPQLAAVEANRTSGGVTGETPALPDPESLPAPVQAGMRPVQTPSAQARPQVAPDARVQTIIADSMSLLQKRPQQVIAARDKLNEAMSLPMSPKQRQEVTRQLSQLAEQWLFGPTVFSGDSLCDSYTVGRGDLLQTIGGRHKVPYEIIMRINRIPRPEALQAGKTIKVPNGPFSVKVNRSTFTLDLYLQDIYVRSFKIGLGKDGYDTPTGLWRVRDGGKQVSPPWSDPDVSGRVLRASDPGYPLGPRWIALDGIEGAAKDRTGFGIHGTNDPDEIGNAVSRGCIRMYNNDVLLVYDCLVPLYSSVEVFD